MPEPGKIKKKKPHRFYDYSLLFTIIFLTVFGLIMIYSASSYKAQLDYGNPGYFMLRQAGIAGVSFVAMEDTAAAGRIQRMNCISVTTTRSGESWFGMMRSSLRC